MAHCVAQAIMGIPSNRRFLAVARKRLRHLFPQLPAQPGYFKRRQPHRSPNKTPARSLLYSMGSARGASVFLRQITACT